MKQQNEENVAKIQPPDNHIRVLDDGQGWIGLINVMGNQTSIVNAARISFQNIKDEFEEKDEKLLCYLLKNKHTTPLEHVVFTFSVHCPLFVRSQWMRHRTWSYNQVSRRYTDQDVSFYLPNILRKQSDSNRQASINEAVENNSELVDDYKNACVCLYHTYLKLLDFGVCREQARGILPQSMMTTFWATVNLNNLLHFLELRDDDHAQVEIREYAVAIKKLIAPYIPHVIKYYGW